MANTGKLDWNDLRHFLAAVRAGTLAGAARMLSVKHSTISRRLDALERALGAAVVLRGPDGLQLTPVGEKLIPFATEIERSVAALQSQAASQTACVRLAFPSGFVKHFTPHVAELRRQHPKISLEFLSGSRPVDLHKGEAELALRVGPVRDDSLIRRKLGEIGWSLYASPDYLARHSAPVDPRQLAGHEVLGFDAGLGDVPGAKWLAEHGAGATIVLLHREITDMAAAAAAGLGLAVLPCIVGDPEPGLKRLTSAVLGCQDLSIVYRREALRAEPVRIVVRFVIGVMRECATSMRG